MSHPVILAAAAVPASTQSNIHDAALGLLAAGVIAIAVRARRSLRGASCWSEAPAVHCGGHGGRILACLGVIAAVLFLAGNAARTSPAAAPAKPVVITHTITRVVNAHPWLTGTEFTWLCIGLGVLIVGAIAIRRNS